MPSYKHLLSTEIDFKKVTDRVWAAQKLGAEYPFELEESPEMARIQAEVVAAEIVSQGGPVSVPRAGKEPLLVLDSQAVALIAYLQRLGVDAFKPPPTETPTEPAAGDAAPEESGANEVADQIAPDSMPLTRATPPPSQPLALNR